LIKQDHFRLRCNLLIWELTRAIKTRSESERGIANRLASRAEHSNSVTVERVYFAVWARLRISTTTNEQNRSLTMDFYHPILYQ